MQIHGGPVNRDVEFIGAPSGRGSQYSLSLTIVQSDIQILAGLEANICMVSGTSHKKTLCNSRARFWNYRRIRLTVQNQIKTFN